MQPAAKPIGVMVVDDHQTMLWGLSKLIDGEKPRMHVVGTARNCEEALEQVGQLSPDIILLDLDLDGRSALEILPGLLSNPASRALILTGEREQKTLDMAVLQGARGVLRKDASAEQVLRAIERVHRGELCMDAETMSRVFSEFMASRQSPRSDPEAEKQAGLTAKERKIIATVVESSGASNKALAQKLFITEHTLRNHLTSIYQKLDVANRLELYCYAVKHQLGKPLS
ncbi:response regulator transcription factor [Variovorax soli]|uniref:DNA-binding NarL/FixJ family response regulator n=1 Tax=Variovorax soli TaxID=376815 RepID=A0ABU1NMG1_9BURK|nr:response regulator transcription factor [Variovorax soli]MDR6539071.1 DNA-binding NarL/FixJ family response regulator [Variovorax soli]